MKLHNKIRQVKHKICQSRKDIAYVRLEAITRGDNPYSLLQIFKR